MCVAVPMIIILLGTLGTFCLRMACKIFLSGKLNVKNGWSINCVDPKYFAAIYYVVFWGSRFGTLLLSEKVGNSNLHFFNGTKKLKRGLILFSVHENVWKLEKNFCATLQGMRINCFVSRKSTVKLSVIFQGSVSRVRAWACRLSTSVADQDYLNLDPAFQLNPDPGFWWPKVKKKIQLKFFSFLFQFNSPQASIKKVQATGEAFRDCVVRWNINIFQL